MNIPAFVKIGPIRFRVEEVKGLTDPEGSHKLNGNILYNACKIRIEQEMDPQQKAVCVWHEVIHGILSLADVDHDEKIPEVLAYGIVAALEDNPWLKEGI